jgi:hypothetical protein
MHTVRWWQFGALGDFALSGATAVSPFRNLDQLPRLDML